MKGEDNVDGEKNGKRRFISLRVNEFLRKKWFR